MANPDTPFGLKPVMHINGAPYNGAVNPYYVAAGYTTSALFIGDPVLKFTDGSNAAAITVPGAGSFAIGTLPEIRLAPVTDNTKITGVIVSFAALPTNLETKHRVASTERVAWVCDDPDILFEIQADGIVLTTYVGLNAQMITTHGGSTVTGLSGYELDISSDVPTAEASNQLLIHRLVNREDNDTTLTHCKVLVSINQHSQTPGTVGALGI